MLIINSTYSLAGFVIARAIDYLRDTTGSAIGMVVRATSPPAETLASRWVPAALGNG